MKIKNVEIKNFRGISEMVLEVDTTNIFLGHCGSGKTSTLMAIRYALTGKCVAEDIKTGADEMSVKLVFSDNSSIERIKGEKSTVKVNGSVTTIKAANEFLEEKFGCSMAVIEAMCGSEFFESLSQKDLTEFILNILPLKVSLAKLIEFCESDIRKLSKEEKDYLTTAFKSNEIITLKDIETQYDICVDNRKKKKAELKIAEAKAVFDESLLPTETKEELEKELESFNLAEANINSYQAQMKAYEESVKNNVFAKQRLQGLQEALDKMSDITEPSVEGCDKAKAERQQFIDALSQARSAKAVNQSNIDLFNRTLSGLHTNVCPLSEKLICSTDKTGLKAELETLISANTKAIADIDEFISKANDQVSMRDNIIENYNKSLIAWNNKVSLSKQINEFIVPPVLEKPNEVPTGAEIGLKKALVASKLEVFKEKALADKALAESKAIKEEVTFFDNIAKLLDVKGGIRSVLLNKALAPVQQIMNEKAKTLRENFSVTLTSSEGLDVRVCPKGTDFVPMEHVSSGEFIFTAYLLMSAINKITGISYLIIDNIDKLDDDATKAFIKLIDTDKAFENVFIAGVDHIDTFTTLNGLDTAKITRF